MIEDTLYAYMNECLKNVTTDFKRYMYSKIDWSARMVGIVGPRGVGKTTMILQFIKSMSPQQDNVLYVSADNMYFSNHTLVGLADEFAKENGTYLCIDEVHKYKGWSNELKQIYDTHPKLHIVFTGSSILDIKKGEADLSRRVLMYKMQGLSFREYLEIFHDIQSPIYTLEEIISHKVSITSALEHPLPVFREYLKSGYYPFAKEGHFELRMEQVVAQTVESDILQFADMKAATARKLKQMLTIIAESVPFKPNMESLATELSISKNNVPDYLVYLEKSGMIEMLLDETSGMRKLGKIEKVYVDNPSLMYVLSGGKPNIGNIRETFFFNQMRAVSQIYSSRSSDFAIGKYTFEVGGRKKGASQIADVENGIIVKDDIEYGHGIVVPLWHFGFCY